MKIKKKIKKKIKMKNLKFQSPACRYQRENNDVKPFNIYVAM